MANLAQREFQKGVKSHFALITAPSECAPHPPRGFKRLYNCATWINRNEIINCYFFVFIFQSFLFAICESRLGWIIVLWNKIREEWKEIVISNSSQSKKFLKWPSGSLSSSATAIPLSGSGRSSEKCACSEKLAVDRKLIQNIYYLAWRSIVDGREWNLGHVENRRPMKHRLMTS